MTALPVTDADIDTLVRTLYGEARGEPLEGQQGVAWVVRNRVEWPNAPHWWGNSVAEVCRKAFQFSSWNANDPNRVKIEQLPVGSPEYQALLPVAQAVCAGMVPDMTGGASHYERVGTGARWAVNRPPTITIGRQAFYRIGPGAMGYTAH